MTEDVESIVEIIKRGVEDNGEFDSLVFANAVKDPQIQIEVLRKLRKAHIVLVGEKIISETKKLHMAKETPPSFFFREKKFIPAKLGEWIMSDVQFKTIKGSEEMYYYAKEMYVPNGDEFIKEMCAKLLKDEFSINHVNETVAYIQASSYVDPNDVENEWINLENGMLNPLTKEFISHTPDIFTVVRTPIIYDPKADCPTWKEELSKKVEKVILDTTQEMFGYCFMPGQSQEKAFLLFGPPRTMKTTTLETLKELVGAENLTSFALQQLNEDTFTAAYLYGKAANICAELTPKALRDTGIFMRIVGGDSISIAKKHQDPVSWNPSTKLIFACNIVPPTTNKNLAFYRRWVMLPFMTQTPLDQVDKHMKEKLRAELPGILNWALEGLERLRTNKKFSLDLPDAEIKDLYEKSSDTISSFILHMIDMEDDEGSLTKREVFKGYLTYCKDNDLQPENVIKFGRMFIALTGCGVGKKGTGEASIPAYKGVNWKQKRIDSIDKSEDLEEEQTTLIDDEEEGENL
jgi:putative DNA primase/helicase